jgi:hypothetical protein
MFSIIATIDLALISKIIIGGCNQCASSCSTNCSSSGGTYEGGGISCSDTSPGS